MYATSVHNMWHVRCVGMFDLNALRVCLTSLLSFQEEAVDKPREPISLAHSAYSLAASAFSQDQLYINGGLNYSYRGYGGLCGSIQHPVSLTTATAQTNGKRGCNLQKNDQYV